jgi:hypothetical protein
VLSKSEAKRELGLPEDTVLLLSVASAYRFKSFNKTPFIEAHIPILEKCKKAVLIAIGPANQGEWLKGAARTGGRLRAVGELEDIEVFYQAADIYVVPFPFGALTSLLEAGSYGVPVISYRTLSAEALTLGPDDPALTNNMICEATIEGYEAMLTRLIEDDAFRSDVGERTRESVWEVHASKGWSKFLRNLYHRATTNPRMNLSVATKDNRLVSGVDLALSDYLTRTGLSYAIHSCPQLCFRLLPLWMRGHLWHLLIRVNQVSILFKEWLLPRIQKG